MKYSLYLSLLAPAVLGLSSCKKEEIEVAENAPTTAHYETKAKEATDLLAKRLGSQLKAALQSGGPEAGIKICQQIGQPLTNSTNEELEGMTVTRTSLKVRNPINAPDAADIEIMSRWQTLLDENAKLPEAETLTNEAKEAVVYKPIITQKLCMQCHGDPSTFSPELNTLLKEYYPDDKATGFSEGSLRGVFKVRFQQQ